VPCFRTACFPFANQLASTYGLIQFYIYVFGLFCGGIYGPIIGA